MNQSSESQQPPQQRTQSFGGEVGVTRMTEQFGRERFIALLAERFPEVSAAIDDCSQGLLHLEMATLARATQAAIDDQDRDTVRRHFQFIDEVFRQAASDVENAVNVSYLENLRFEGRKAAPTKARELLTPRLRQALAELEEYLARLFGKRGPAEPTAAPDRGDTKFKRGSRLPRRRGR